MGTAAQRQHFVKNILFIPCLSRNHNGSIVQVSRVHMRGVYARVVCACSFALSSVAALPTFPVATSWGESQLLDSTHPQGQDTHVLSVTTSAHSGFMKLTVVF